MKYIFSLVILLDYNILVIFTPLVSIYMALCCVCVCAMERIYTVMVIFFQEGVSFQGACVDTCPRNPGNQQSLWVQMKHVVEAGNYPVIRPLNH